MMEKTIEFLENMDLNPKFKEEKKGSRNPLAGIIMIIYFPLLILYLYYTIQPQYGSLPSCCACASIYTPVDSWVFQAANQTCSNDPTCRAFVQSQLAINCDAALQYRPIPDYNLSVNIAQIGCVGLKPGDTCDHSCLDVSNRWINNLDYTYQDNQDQAKIRCPLRVGACDFKAVYTDEETTPHAVCRYPEMSGILTRVGAGLGLLNGMLITLRLMLRTCWNRIGTKGDAPGTINDYWKGLAIGLVFNYFGVMYLTMAHGINKRFRYGGQLAIGFLIIFLKSPFVVYLIVIFSQYWTPMCILLLLGCGGVSILIRTTYNLLNLEIYSRNCVVISQDVEEYDYEEQNIQYIPPDRIKPVIYSKWRHFFLGFVLNIFALYPLMKHNIKRYSANNGTDSGSGSGSTDSQVGASSTSSDNNNEFQSSNRILYRTSLLQSAYFAVCWSLSMVICFHFALFIKYLPERRSILPSFLKRPQGTRIDYRMGFVASVIPLAFTYFCFFYFEFTPYVSHNLPKTPSECSFPGWTLVIPGSGIIPSLAFFLFGYTERFKYGSLSAIGTSLILFCLGTSVLLFNYCLGPNQDYYYPWSWLVGLVGTFILIYGAIRPNQIYILDKKNHHQDDFHEEERLLKNKSFKD
ncbi:hypothetical protein PPL_01942 [Heterostelium album PN500]|uniref:Transmembrane protein n=1 Tax=Heterostelium pallidum (strain ATCC 26659 / Pp 5 / PN500) TaxID=670386 RepID=D3B0X5_HETP5|nr:hypothetical protein PPL_01942 [Heterostelium album PN500]EFA84949.1 hypothetical protein PPL_01942 [Heterostelium album PN500]|eukprot:XP_020437059.1 hypothetical protein PPL_01942 [Heterostelium album PN500]